MLNLFLAVVRRDLMLALRQKSDIIQTLFFFAVVITLVPLGVGAEQNLLRTMAPGVVWVAALLAAGVAGITLFSRRPEQGAELAAAFPGVQARPLDWSRLADDLAGHNMLVNGTSLGMHGMSQDFADTAFLAALPATGVVCDVVYRPQRTTLLAGAEALGLATVGGAGMLIHQGVLALEHFLNRELDRAAMARVVWQALRPRLED